MRSAKAEALRRAIAAVMASAPRGHDYVTIPRLADVLGINEGREKEILRKSLRELLHTGELEKVNRGQWRPTGKKPIRRNLGFEKIWRTIRSAPGSTSTPEIVQYAAQSRTYIKKCLDHLESAGLIRRSGKTGNIQRYSLTTAGREQCETPYPKKEVADSHLKERAAAAEILRVLLCEDMEKTAHHRNIRNQLTILNTRFGGSNAE